MADERQRLFEGTLPLDDVDSTDIELAGRMAELLDRLRAAFDDLSDVSHRRCLGEHLGADLGFSDRDL